MDNAVKVKQKACEQWKGGCSKEKYLKAKWDVRAALYFAKKDDQAWQFASINHISDKNRIFKMTKRLKRDNVDVVGEKYVWKNEGKLTLTADEKLRAWQLHYQKLVNVEFPWNASNLSDKPPLEVPAIKITTEIVSKGINKMKAGKATGPSGIIIEIIKTVKIYWDY